MKEGVLKKLKELLAKLENAQGLENKEKALIELVGFCSGVLAQSKSN